MLKLELNNSSRLVKSLLDMLTLRASGSCMTISLNSLQGVGPLLHGQVKESVFNTGRSRIWGVDATVFFQYKIKKDISIDLIGSYTYSMPQTLEPHKNYGYDSFGSLSYSKTASDTTDNILKYRIRHTVKVDLNIDIKNFYFGFTTRYYGPMENIDQFFITLDLANLAFDGMYDFMQSQNKGSILLDARVSYKVKNFKFAFIIDNLLSSTYSVRPMGVSAPRLTTIQVTYKL